MPLSPYQQYLGNWGGQSIARVGEISPEASSIGLTSRWSGSNFSVLIK